MEGFALLFAIMALAGMFLLGYEYRPTVSVSPRGWLVSILYGVLGVESPQDARRWGWRLLVGSVLPFALYLVTM